MRHEDREQSRGKAPVQPDRHVGPEPLEHAKARRQHEQEAEQPERDDSQGRAQLGHEITVAPPAAGPREE